MKRPIPIKTRQPIQTSNFLETPKTNGSSYPNLRYDTPPKRSKLDLPMFDGIYNKKSPSLRKSIERVWASVIEIPVTQVQDYSVEYYNRRTVVVDGWKSPSSLNMSYDGLSNPRSRQSNRSYQISDGRNLRHTGALALRNNSSFSMNYRDVTPEKKRIALPASLGVSPTNINRPPPIQLSTRSKRSKRLAVPSLQQRLPSRQSIELFTTHSLTSPSNYSVDSDPFYASEISSQTSIFDGPKISLLYVDNTKRNVKKMYQEFMGMQERIKYTPIQAYEVLLYGACRRSREVVGRNELNISAIEDFYPLVKLGEKKGDLGYIHAELYKYRLKELLKTHPNSNEELKTMGLLLRVINGLLIHWNIAKPKQYAFRFKPEHTSIFHIDLTSFTKGIVVLDVLWLCFSPEHYALMSNEQQKLAQALRQGFLNIINQIVGLNEEADFETVPSIEGYATTEFPALTQLGFRPSEVMQSLGYRQIDYKPLYAELSLPKPKARKLEKNRPIADFYERMRVFENVYKQFEQTLLKELPKSF